MRQEEEKRDEQRRRHAQVMRQQFPNPADHWMVSAKGSQVILKVQRGHMSLESTNRSQFIRS